jgi:hypothetical protein
MAEGNIFTGLGDLYNPSVTPDGNKLQQLKVFPGHVIDICMDENSPLYESPKDIGKILFRDLAKEFNRPEKEIKSVAYPLDRSVARYPMQGEEVIIYRAIGEGGTSKTSIMANICFYSFVVSAMHNVTFNSNPFIGTDSAHIDPNNPFVSRNEAKKRFDNKLKDINTVKDASDLPKVYKQLIPYTGDFILQGRFGNTIRFGSTSLGNDSSWSKSGVSGDGIMVLRVNNDFASDETSMMTTENINKDDASIYMCTSQRIEMDLACSKELKSWKAVYNLEDKSTTGLQKKQIDLVSTDWQKVLSATKSVKNEYKNPK